MDQRPLFIHIGLQKTGTSYLQRIFWDSVPELASQGLSLVPGSKLAMFRLALDVRDRYNPEIDPPSVAHALERLPRLLEEAPGAALITQEALSAATRPQVERLLAATEGRDVRVIVTVRDLGRLIPSAWQQTLQGSRSQTLDEFARRLEASVGTNATPWRTMDVPTILARWNRFVPADRITVVTVPPSGSDPQLLLDRFCGVLGISADGLTVDERSRGNRGLRAEQAEVLRRVNALLPDEVKRRDVYGDLGKRYFAVQVLGGDEGTPIRLPAARQEWVTHISHEFIDAIKAGGYAVAGDLDDLLPQARHFATDDLEVPDEAVAGVATKALADMLVDRMHARAEAAAEPVQPAQPPAAEPAAPGWRARVARLRAAW
ncbi:hypothetical protein E8D34_09750 [Nocardioides sp. GY 10113]|uniref:hypothetical protein n=1 Tax=Nocardioides sp. GY 10113 TaxID=2569761 RepID=UPI0010A91C6F|nr:hypothetical protein [Nocardioides sp. GY 10113]TIC87406.1 hypothetical protein E8D34_09750 [Nocardioides sp. GY 10113]